MPTYQYACTECGHAFDQFQSFSDDALTECPECQGRLRKVFNAVGVVFKGSGFYRNDSREQEDVRPRVRQQVGEQVGLEVRLGDVERHQVRDDTSETKSDASSSTSPKAPASA